MNPHQDHTPAGTHPTGQPTPATPAGERHHPPAGPTARTGPTQARGRRRRATLLAAAVDLLTQGGFAAVTHRAVAHHANLPLAATTYYFASRDQLLAEAFAQLVETELTTTRTWITDHGLAALTDQIATADRTRQLGLWELYVHAGRDPVLQQIARRWADGCIRLIADTLHLPETDPRVRLLYTTLSTLWLEQVVEQRPLDEARTLLTLAINTAENTLPPP
ncbi:TetR/AcrR family transcriptional regulator [Nonomuraea angiospora]|uniref:TetR/AcrR family transcriptional regulator n=2 Tax=Nonomuraea angiospora TaxID=46172 RepID=UPI0037B14216